MAAEHTIINNEQLMHFEIHDGDEIAFLEYRFYKKDIAFMHTNVPEPMEGRGIASALAGYAFRYAKEHNKQVMVYCPFVSEYVKKHPELRSQLAESHH